MENQPEQKKHESPRVDLLKTSTIAYAVMGVVGFEICWWYHQNVKSLLGPVTYDRAKTLGITAAAIAFLLLAQRLMEDFFPSYAGFKQRLAKIFGGIGWLGALWLALISAFGEEILFRGAIQPFLGLWFTSALFGLLHLDPEGGVSTWTVWAILAGILLGAVVQTTGSLWPAIGIHFVVNFIGILSLARIKPATVATPSRSSEGSDSL